ncbi:hypothetical protein L9F63_028115, partial [Diploptera punctata]
EPKKLIYIYILILPGSRSFSHHSRKEKVYYIYIIFNSGPAAVLHAIIEIHRMVVIKLRKLITLPKQ